MYKRQVVLREGELGETKDKIEEGGMADETEASTAGFIFNLS